MDASQAKRDEEAAAKREERRTLGARRAAMLAEAEALLDQEDLDRAAKLKGFEAKRAAERAYIDQQCVAITAEKDAAAERLKRDRIQSKREDLASAERQVKEYCRTGKLLPTLRADARRLAHKRQGNAKRMFRAIRERDAFFREAEEKQQQSLADQPEVLEA